MNPEPFWYLATPYSKYAAGTDEAFREAARAAATLMTRGIKVFCPITHSHPIARYGNLSQFDHDFWLPADKPLMDAAVGLIVVTMDGWEKSYGIGEEMKTFAAAGKPVMFLEWHDGVQIDVR